VVSIERSRNALGRQLCSPSLELALAGTGRIDLDSIDLSVFSVEALDEVLDLASFWIASEDALVERLLSLGDGYRPLLGRIEIRFLSAAALAIVAEHFVFPPEWVFCGILDRLPRWNSTIVPHFPKLFEDFKENHFTLLWRGSRDCFGSGDFHARCDGHAHTLTVVMDIDGNIFGGFTPLEWESRAWNNFKGNDNNTWKPDPSSKSFIFTLVNPDKVPPMKFTLRNQNWALRCSFSLGPTFGNNFVVSNDSDTNARSFARPMGGTYGNDAWPTSSGFTTKSSTTVKEIEVFEIVD
jgi:hypothetical protein